MRLKRPRMARCGRRRATFRTQVMYHPLRERNVDAVRAQRLQDLLVDLRAQQAGAVFRIADPETEAEFQPVGTKVLQVR